MEPILSVKDLSKNFGTRKAVDNITFQVARGEVMGLLGPNGAGKTTAIRMIMGILPADRGEISFSFNGRPGPLNKTKIGYLPEERGLYDDVKVVDNLIYLSGLKGIPPAQSKRDALDWLERLDLSDYAYQKLEKLSKGMQQKVQFIASILHRPPLVFLDEPFSGLDPVNQDFITGIIREMQDSGVTILLSAHQMNLVEALCDSIFLINRGVEVLSGSLKQIKHSYKETIVELKYPPGSNISFLHTIPGLRKIQETPDQAMLRYSGRLPVSRLLATICEHIPVEGVSVEKPPLHEIFVETVKERGANHDS